MYIKRRRQEKGTDFQSKANFNKIYIFSFLVFGFKFKDSVTKTPKVYLT